MAVNLKELAQRLEQEGYPVGAKRLRNVASSWRRAGLIPESLPVHLEFISLASQVARFVKLGFHTEVYPELSVREAVKRYKSDFTLPDGAAKPNEYVGRFDLALVVEPRIPLRRKHNLAKQIKKFDLESVARNWETSQVEECINTGEIQDLTEHPTDRPYLIFTHDGRIYRSVSVQKALTFFAPDEVGSPQLEVTDLFLQIPGFFKGRAIEAAGSRYGDGHVPYLSAFGVRPRPRVDAHPIDSQSLDRGALSRGEEIIRLGV